MLQKIWDEKYSAGDSLNRYPWDKIVSFVCRYHNREKPRNETRILELGFGSGCNLWFCAREGFDCYGVEGSAIAVEHAKSWFKHDGLKADLRIGDFSPLDFESDYFDIAFDRCSLTCVNFDNCLSSFKEVYRVLKKGGYFFFNPYGSEHTSCKEGKIEETGLTRITSGSLVGVGDLKFYDRNEIESLVKEAGFQIKYIKHTEEIEILSNQNHSEWQVVLKK